MTPRIEVYRFALSTFSERIGAWRTFRKSLLVWQTTGVATIELDGVPRDVGQLATADGPQDLAGCELVVYSTALAHHLHALVAHLDRQDPPPPPDPPLGSQP